MNMHHLRKRLQETGSGRALLAVLAFRTAPHHFANPDTRIYVRGDRSIEYGRIMEVMGSVGQAGFKKVSLLANLPDGK